MIYFAQLPNRAIKIGCTTNLSRRRLRLRVELGCEVFILWSMEGDKKRERELHDQFSHLRLGTSEQFQPGDELMDLIGQPRCHIWRDVEQMPIRHMGTKPTQIRLTKADLELFDLIRREEELGSLAEAIRFAGIYALENSMEIPG